MTRDERIAAGWAECWVVKAPTQGVYSRGLAPADKTQWTNNLAEAFKFSHRDDAFDWLVAWHKNRPSKLSYDLRIFHVWRRKKPKAPPPLKVGDEVVVRGRVTSAPDEVLVNVQASSGRIICPRVSDCERVKP